jgi:2-dehydro-3-deoxyphosphogluconate aldolase/(4S)-4-hydroxy-2-oxoglutarate aldolase
MAKTNVILNRIKDLGLIAVIRGPSPVLTIDLVAALVSAGIQGIEITFTTPDALNIVQELEEKYGNKILLGMGTLTKVDHAESAAQAGAKFIVSPHLNTDLARAMKKTGLVTILGALTPSEIAQAYYEYEADIVKVFPGSLVGPGYFQALRGPYPGLPMMPSGGVNKSNLLEWFSAGAFVVGVGGNLFPRHLIEERAFEEITIRAKEYLGIINQRG